MHRIAGLISAGILTAGGVAAANSVDDCAQTVNWTIKFEGCTALIENGEQSGAALDLDPRMASALSNRGDAYSLPIALAAIALDPSAAESFTSRGEAYARLRQYDHAIADFEQALRLDPENTVARRNRAIALNEVAWALYLEGQAAEGLPAVEEALTVLPTRPTIIGTRAHIFAALGRTDDALIEFEHAMTAGGTDVVYTYRLALSRHGLDPGPADGRWRGDAGSPGGVPGRGVPAGGLTRAAPPA